MTPPTTPTPPADPSPPTGPAGPATPITETVATPAGEARITWHPAPGPRLVLAAGHGAGGGIEARDLRALAAELPRHGVSVALVEQPWRVAGKKVAPAPRTLDTAWRALWPALARPGLPVIAAGRSAGARVACRTAGELGAHAVLALSFPLHPPGRPERTRAPELLGTGVPTLVVQGGRDPFGRPEEFPEGPYEIVEVPHADHGFAVPKRAEPGQEEALARIAGSVVRWVASLG
ncbi:alpha/beta hydrolase family protein [Streptomyces griseoaurantiacus]|uniref:Esterase/lipase/thioesterase family active site n=2 Tax=Streptomyces griseoaurantiacus TaxID=68213 RepID=F3NMW3_9ACTN|nr:MULTISPECIES: alpha/beta family hydrolase [Streptomyces]EGG45149.1 Esterase/lipase/thioesterase family active site [Streptomyces griseoaurantiacus M045]SDE87378.1 hypothetical protein SAMN05216260_104246 [Streptomyces jietaisiensis]